MKTFDLGTVIGILESQFRYFDSRQKLVPTQGDIININVPKNRIEDVDILIQKIYEQQRSSNVFGPYMTVLKRLKAWHGGRLVDK